MFALIYEPADLQEIADRWTEARGSSSMTQAQRRDARDYWNAGLSEWQNAQPAPAPHNASCPNCVAVPVSIGSKANFLTLCIEIVNRLPPLSIEYFNAIVDDMKSAGIVEPWP